MVTDEVTKQPSEPVNGGKKVSDIMQEGQVGRRASGVIYSPLLQKQFQLVDHPNLVVEKMGQGVVTPGGSGSMGVALHEKEIEFDNISIATAETEKICASSAASEEAASSVAVATEKMCVSSAATEEALKRSSVVVAT